MIGGVGRKPDHLLVQANDLVLGSAFGARNAWPFVLVFIIPRKPAGVELSGHCGVLWEGFVESQVICLYKQMKP